MEGKLIFPAVAREVTRTSVGQNLHVYNKNYFVLLSVVYNAQNCKPAL